MNAIPCRKCLEESADLRALAEHLDRYVDSLSDDIRVGPETYAKRVALCESCPRRVELLCSVCGCYIQARAAKKRMACPIDFGEPRWQAEPDQS
jgi:hypothetical protein